MERSDVEEYVERSASLIESSPQMNEENTKAKIIRPLIELLGWDIYSGDVELEYSMQIGRGNTRADYALLVGGNTCRVHRSKGVRYNALRFRTESIEELYATDRC